MNLLRLSTFALLLLPLATFAQKEEGRILFKETVKLNIELPDDAPEEIKKMLPPEQTNQQVLLFNLRATLYRDLNEKDQKDLEVSHDDGEGGQVQIKMMRPQNVLYRDLDEDKVIESREFMGRTFLIKDEVNTQKWKLTGEKKTILHFDCQKAVLVDSTKNVVAWFSTDIPVSSGPEAYNGLPGMILELDIDQGKRTYVATKAEIAPLEKDAIKAPTKGKECTRADYEKIVAEKMKEMNAENGGGGMKIIIKDRN
jgi:GLPGLI family protein